MYGNPEFMMSADWQTDRYNCTIKIPGGRRAGILFFYYSIKITGAAASTYSSTDTGGNWFPDSRRAGITHDSVILMESQSCRIDIILHCPNMMSTGQFCGFMNPHCHRRVS